MQLEQVELITSFIRYLEVTAIGAYLFAAIEALLPAGQLEALRQQAGKLTGAAHAVAEARVVVIAVPALAQQANHMLGPQRVVLV